MSSLASIDSGILFIRKQGLRTRTVWKEIPDNAVDNVRRAQLFSMLDMYCATKYTVTLGRQFLNLLISHELRSIYNNLINSMLSCRARVTNGTTNQTRLSFFLRLFLHAHFNEEYNE